ncbi:SET domain-containing protein [Arachidicoccus sp.]|uniref:SET domain-containing protein n=1 Tax=Arachidicoccus sp. TaxID=1872624 RepID=UPI003D24396A
MIFPFLTIAPSGNKGKGVFTSENIPANTVIEISPVIVLSAKERKHLEHTKLYHYIFEWGDSRKKAAVALGYISMYNHSYDANCEYEMDFEDSSITIKTVKAIKKGEELHINYNAVPNDATEVWFHHLIEQP